MAKLRAAVVNAHTSPMSRGDSNSGAVLRLGKGETGDRRADKSSILADAFESTLGAL